jgi:hypothetical protein
LVNKDINLKIPLQNENYVEESILYFNTAMQNTAWNTTQNSEMCVTKPNNLNQEKDVDFAILPQSEGQTSAKPCSSKLTMISGSSKTNGL